MPPTQPHANGDVPNGSVGVIVVAAGTSRRMDGVDKVFEPILGTPALAHLLTTFQDCTQVGEVVLVLSEHNLERGRELVAAGGWSKVTRVCLGGPLRQDSVRAGMDCLSPCEWTVVHDGARPCLTQELLCRSMAEAVATGAAVPALPITDTVKRVLDGLVVETVSRDGLWAVQTPQVFRSELLRAAHKTDAGPATDDASLVEQLGHRVRVFPGSPENIKITTPSDLALAEAILLRRTGR